MIELEVHNFQSIKHTKVVVDGFAGIEGRSNIGKSAFIRAIHCALTGAVGTDFVRHGSGCERRVRGSKKCSCSTKVTFKSPSVHFTWEKGDSINKYTHYIEGREPKVYSGVDRGTPDFLLPLYQMAEIGGSKELIQIPNQFEPLFLLNQSGPAVADILSDVARLDCLNKATSLAVKDRKDLLSKKKVRDEDIKTLKQSLERYSGLDKLPLEELVSSQQALDSRKKDLGKTDKFITSHDSLVGGIDVLARVVSIETPETSQLNPSLASLNKLEYYCRVTQQIKAEALELSPIVNQVLPEVQDLAEKRQEFLKVSYLAPKHEELTFDLGRLEGVDSLDIPNPKGLDRSLANTLLAEGFMGRLKGLADILKKYQGYDVSEVPSIEGISEDYTRLRQVDRFSQQYSKLESSLQEVPSLGQLDEIQVKDATTRLTEVLLLSRNLQKLQGLEETVDNLTREFQEVTHEADQISKELVEMGALCSSCGQVIRESHKHKGA